MKYYGCENYRLSKKCNKLIKTKNYKNIPIDNVNNSSRSFSYLPRSIKIFCITRKSLVTFVRAKINHNFLAKA